MISADIVLFTLMVVVSVNLARALTALRSLLYVMREAHPLLYQQVDGRGFFTTHGNMTKQVRLFYYIRSREYMHHHDPVFIKKCDKVRGLFILFMNLLGVTLLAGFII
ncbi:universal stress protein UspB [Vibrio sp. HA2012]|uniref:universal stress protein UspB n=1 Tax=Vibrio sp. HA2012 TaxID=1971595 RepID=UPI000C2CB21D|nr:universal stress protein UspB [Vibrio sp. HA2012]PJC85099.1 universal stress protein UspB [Vibrio sp. HA2012]